jgi:preprotein translocase subunit SecG
MLSTLILIVHLIVSLFLIVIVLIQGGKGSEMGAAFGGSSQTLFGARGAATFFSKLTTVAAVVFMISSFLLSIVESRSGSIMNAGPAATQQQKSNIPQQGTGPVQGQPVLPAPPSAPAVPATPTK